MHLSKSRIAAALFVLLILFNEEEQAHAQTPLPVFVNFQFRESVKHPGIVASENAISTALAATLKDEFRYWDLRPGKPTDFPRLDVWLEQQSAWDMKMEFFANASTRKPDAPWQCVLFETGETDRRFQGGLPQVDQFKAEINKAFKSRMIVAQREAIATVLRKYAPLGKAVGMGQSTDAVLPLSWDTYRALGQSQFKLLFLKGSTGNDVITLTSKGAGRAEPFPGAVPPWNGIAIKHIKYDADDISGHVNDLRQPLRLQFFFLDSVVDILTVGDDNVVPIP